MCLRGELRKGRLSVYVGVGGGGGWGGGEKSCLRRGSPVVNNIAVSCSDLPCMTCSDLPADGKCNKTVDRCLQTLLKATDNDEMSIKARAWCTMCYRSRLERAQTKSDGSPDGSCSETMSTH